MKIKSKISAIIVSMALMAGVGATVSGAMQNSLEVKAADATTTIAVKLFNGTSGTGYVTTANTDSTHYDVTVTLNNFIPDIGQVRGNQNSGAGIYTANTFMFNTTTKSGYYIKSVVLSGSGATFTEAASRNLCQFGTSAFSTPASSLGQAAVVASTSLTWTVADAATNNYGYMQMNSLKTSGSMVNATIAITWGLASTDAVTQLNVSPSSKSYSLGDVIAATDYTVTATLNGTPDSAYSNYRAEVGSLSESTFTKRADVVFGTTAVASGDNCLRFYAQDPTVLEGSAYATADVTLVVSYATLESIAVSPTSAQLLVGGTQQVSVTPTPANANPSVSWVSSNDLIASVSSSGLITAVALGNASITATSTADSSKTASVAVSVIELSGYSLITSLTQLTEGMKIVIGGTKTSTSTTYAMGAQGGNNRAAIESTLTSGVLTPGEGYSELTLGITTKGEATVYTFHDASGYLYAASSSNNYLKSEAAVTDNSKWLVTLTGGVFSLVAQGTNTRNIMRFNSSNNPPLFSAYSTGQDDVALYGIISDPQAEQDAAAFAASFISATETCSTSASGVWTAQKTAFQALSSNAKAILVNATYVASNYASNTDVQKCVQRYDLAVSKQSLENFMGRAAISSAPLVNFNYISTSGSVIAIIVISIISLSALSFVVLKRKNK